MLISEEYRSLNKQLHKESQHYGTSGYLHAKQIKELCMSLGTKDVLDYGCGKSTLLRCINLLEIPDEGQIEIGGKLVGDP